MSPIPDAMTSADTALMQTCTRMLSAFAMDSLPGHVLVFVNGTWVPALSRVGAPQDGVWVTSLRYAMAHGHPILTRAVPHSIEGALIHVAAGVHATEPVHCIFLVADHGSADRDHGATQKIQPSIVIVAEARSSATVFESFLGDAHAAPYSVDATTAVLLDDEAALTHVRMHRESEHGTHISCAKVQQAQGSNYTSHVMSLGGKSVAHTVDVQLRGEHAACELYGLYTGYGHSRIDHHTNITHAAPTTKSRQVYKGIVNGSAMGTFQGKVVVQAHAQHTDAAQRNKNLVLSRTATVHTRPELEIYADDVKCAHGATVGQLDEQALFYMRSRGIGVEEARRKLTMAFANDVLEALPPGAHSAAIAQCAQAFLAEVCR